MGISKVSRYAKKTISNFNAIEYSNTLTHDIRSF